MKQAYSAKAKRNPGRQSWLIEFRHPLKRGADDKSGKKTRKGLGTTDPQRAELLEQQLNQLLANEALWSLGARSEAAKLYEPEVIEIFYSEIEPRSTDARSLRDKLLPLPTEEDGYARVALIGVPGAGKTTLVRQLMGTHPESERFPSTSVNRTTTFPTEVVLGTGPYEAAVTFMSEHETRFEIEECVSAAIVEATSGEIKDVARTFLEKSDMRFRLKYMLGDLNTGLTDVDPYDDESDEPEISTDQESLKVTTAESAQFESTVRGYLDRIMAIATHHKDVVENEHGAMADMKPEDRSAALDLIEEQATLSDEYVELVSDILDELRTKFDLVSAGRFEKTTTGWPRAWTLTSRAEDRAAFIANVRFFSGIAVHSWGKLLTPLVNGLRVRGPFRPAWSSQEPRLVLLDTEGLGHKANATADLPEQTTALLHEAHVILLVDSAKNGMTNFAAGKAIESIVNAGHTRKLSIVFTHMDMVSGESLKGQAKIDHVFNGIRNVVDNQLARNISAEAARYALERLKTNTFYVGRIDKAEAKGAGPELERLLSGLTQAQPAVKAPIAFPEYSLDNLVLAIQEAARDFRAQWQGRLGIAANETFKPSPWQSIKALSRRYAEGWGEHYELRPSANLTASLAAAISRFLENPISWSADATDDEKRDTVDRIKAEITRQLPTLARVRLRDNPQPSWHSAWSLRGTGSTMTRRINIEGIYAEWVPIPDSRGDRATFAFMEEVKDIVMRAVTAVREEVESN